MAVRSRHRRNGKVYMVATFVVLALLWIVYWYAANQIASAALERASAAATARGYSLNCEDETIGGFPLSVDVACTHTRLAEATGAFSANIEGFQANAPLYRPGRVETTATGPLVLDAPGKGISLTANWREAETTLNAGLGGLSGIATYVEELNLHLPPTNRSLPLSGLALANANLVISPESSDDYRVSASALAVELATGDGRQLPEIDIEAELVALGFGSSLGLDPRNALRGWLTGGGTLQIEDLEIIAGAVSTNYTGTLVLSPDGSLSGDIKVTITGLEALPELAEAFRPGSRDNVAQIAAAVAVFTKPVESQAGISREMMMLVRNNVVSIGIFPIGVIPKIRF
jgi:hypothetical protein